MLKKLFALTITLALVLSLGMGVSAEVKQLQIEFWFGLGGNLGDLVLNVIDEFNASQDEIVVTGVQQASYGDTISSFLAAQAAGDMPACVLAGSEAYPLLNRGIFEVLDSYIEADETMDITDFLDAAMLYCHNSHGEVVGFPLFATTQVLYYNVAAFENAGVDPEWAFENWQNLAEAAEKIAVRVGGETTYYGWEPMAGSGNMIDAVYSAGGTVYADEEQRTVNLLSDEWVDVLESFRKWIHDDKTMTIHFGGEGWEYWYKTIDDVMEGRAAGYTGSSGDQGDLDFTRLAAHIQPGWGDHVTQPQTNGVCVFVAAQASAEERQAAYTFLTYLTDPSVQARISMSSGYVPVRHSTLENEEYAAYIETNPQAVVPMKQLDYCTTEFRDITGGGISDAISDAVDMIQIENIPGIEALTIAQAAAQEALDEYWAGQE